MPAGFLNNPGDFVSLKASYKKKLKQEKKEGAKISPCRASSFQPEESCSLALTLQ
jgi:hypothetical protein